QVDDRVELDPPAEERSAYSRAGGDHVEKFVVAGEEEAGFVAVQRLISEGFVGDLVQTNCHGDHPLEYRKVAPRRPRQGVGPVLVLTELPRGRGWSRAVEAPPQPPPGRPARARVGPPHHHPPARHGAGGSSDARSEGEAPSPRGRQSSKRSE